MFAAPPTSWSTSSPWSTWWWWSSWTPDTSRPWPWKWVWPGSVSWSPFRMFLKIDWNYKGKYFGRLQLNWIELRWKQARKLGRCDSYLRNYQWLTDSLTGVSAGRCYRILKNKIITSVFVVVLGEVVAAGSYFTLGGVPCHMLVSGLISSRQCGKQWFSNATMVTMTRSNVCKL